MLSRAVESPRIPHGFQVVRFRHVPLAIFRGFIEVRAEMDRVANFFQLGQRNRNRAARRKPDFRQESAVYQLCPAAMSLHTARSDSS